MTRCAAAAPIGSACPMFFEGTSAIVTLALLPLMRRGVALVRAGGSWPTMAARAGIVGALFAFAHIFGMVALRKLVYLGMGLNYEFNFPTEVPYEFRKDIVSALLIGLAFCFSTAPCRRSNQSARESNLGTPVTPRLRIPFCGFATGRPVSASTPVRLSG